MSKSRPFYLRAEPYAWNDPAEMMEDFETEEQAAERHAARCHLMVRGKSSSKPNFYWCTKADPCDSAACPKCMREFRRWWTDAAITLLEEGTGPLCAATLVQHSLICAPEKLVADLDKASRQLARHIDRAGLNSFVAIGGFDFSYNQPLYPLIPHWQPHAYVVFQGVEPKTVKGALSPFYPSAMTIPRPIRTRVVTKPMDALTYAMKAIFFCRSSYVDGTGRANTRCLPLSSQAERELLSVLDRLHPADRLFLKNVRRRGSNLVRKEVR